VVFKEAGALYTPRPERTTNLLFKEALKEKLRKVPKWRSLMSKVLKLIGGQPWEQEGSNPGVQKLTEKGRALQTKKHTMDYNANGGRINKKKKSGKGGTLGGGGNRKTSGA